MSLADGRYRRVLPLLLVTALAGPRRAEALGAPVEIGSIDIESLLDLSVQSVTRRLERASEAPASVFVVTADEIRAQGFRTLSEVLGSVPGVFVYPGKVEQVGVRGMGILGDFTTRVLFLVDGHPLTNSLGNDVSRGFPVPLAAIQRVEVIKGPAGSVYGPSAFFGVVNIVTTGAIGGGEVWAGGEAMQGAVNGSEVSGAVRGQIGQVKGVAAASRYTTDGFTTTFPEIAAIPGLPAGAGVFRGSQFGDAANGYLRGSWRGLAAAGSCGYSHTGFIGMPTDPRSVLEMLTCFADLTWRAEVTRDLTLTSRIAFDEFEPRAGRAETPPVSIGYLENSGSEHWGTVEERADWRPLAWLRVDAGATYRLHGVREQASSAIPILNSTVDKTFSELNTWTSLEVKATRDLALHGGVNFFSHSLFGSRLTPKIAAVWQPTREDTMKAIWSMGFRPPTFIEAYFSDNVAFLANPDLKPEKVSSSEAVYEHRFGSIVASSLSLFWNRYTDLIRYESVPNPLTGAGTLSVARNSPGSLDLLGAEMAMTVRWGNALQAHGGVSLQHLDEEGRPNFPAVTANLAVSTRALWERLLLSARGSVISGRDKAPPAASLGQRTSVPAAFLVGAAASLEIPGVDGLHLDLSVQNLLDAANPSPSPSEFSPITEFPGMPRTFRGDVRWTF